MIDIDPSWECIAVYGPVQYSTRGHGNGDKSGDKIGDKSGDNRGWKMC